MPTTPSSPTTLSLPDPATARAVYEQLLDQIRGVDPSALSSVNLDVSVAVRVALGALPLLDELKPKLSLLPSQLFDMSKVLNVKSYAFAAWYAHLVKSRKKKEGKSYVGELGEAKELRKALLGDAEALAKRGLLSPTRVAQIRSGQGNLDVANDLVALAAEFEANWDTVFDKTATTEDEVQRAEELGAELIVALAVEEAPQTLEQPEDLVAQAFTLFYAAYEECRRGVAFVRYHQGDADQLFPSLYSGRRRKKAAGSKPGSAETAAA